MMLVGPIPHTQRHHAHVCLCRPGGDTRKASSSAYGWTERLTAPLRFGLADLLPSMAKLGSAATVSAVGGSAIQRLASQLVSQHIAYHAAAAAATQLSTRGAASAVVALQQRAALMAAQRGLTSATARYAALRGALGWLGPVMWGWAALDLALASLGTDYARIIRAVFFLAQVRLVATHGFTPGQVERA